MQSDTSKLESKTYASATVYGSSCVNGILPGLIAYIDKKKEKYKRIAGKDAIVVHKHILPVESDIQALLTCKVVFDHVFSPRQNQQALTNTALAVGSACEAECQMVYYEKEAPALVATLKKITGIRLKVLNTNESAYRLLCISNRLVLGMHGIRIPRLR